MRDTHGQLRIAPRIELKSARIGGKRILIISLLLKTEAFHVRSLSLSLFLKLLWQLLFRTGCPDVRIKMIPRASVPGRRSGSGCRRNRGTTTAVPSVQKKSQRRAQTYSIV